MATWDIKSSFVKGDQDPWRVEFQIYANMCQSENLNEWSRHDIGPTGNEEELRDQEKGYLTESTAAMKPTYLLSSKNVCSLLPALKTFFLEI